MSDLQDKVKEVVTGFVANFKPFTALDISNEVKKTLPYVRHGQVRDEVKNLFVSDIKACGYDKKDIQVTLSNGTVTTAVLYFDMADSWDLDKAYDSGKRNAVATPPAPVVAATTDTVEDDDTPTTNAVKDWMSGKIDIKDIPGATFSALGFSKPSDPLVMTALTDKKVLSSTELWEALFNDKTSLFPNH